MTQELTVEELQRRRDLIDTPEKLEWLREVSKTAWFGCCILNDNLTSEGMVDGFNRMIAERQEPAQ